jgi:hypothetical protein
LADLRYCWKLSEGLVSLNLSDFPEELMARLRPAMRAVADMEGKKLEGYLKHRRDSRS